MTAKKNLARTDLEIPTILARFTSVIFKLILEM